MRKHEHEGGMREVPLIRAVSTEVTAAVDRQYIDVMQSRSDEALREAQDLLEHLQRKVRKAQEELHDAHAQACADATRILVENQVPIPPGSGVVGFKYDSDRKTVLAVLLGPEVSGPPPAEPDPYREIRLELERLKNSMGRRR